MREAGTNVGTREWLRHLDRHRVALTLVAWALFAAWTLYDRANAVRFLALGDTDDNLRMEQVRAWLNGQGWYDLRQYELGGARGFDVH